MPVPALRRISFTLKTSVFHLSPGLSATSPSQGSGAPERPSQAPRPRPSPTPTIVLAPGRREAQGSPRRRRAPRRQGAARAILQVRLPPRTGAGRSSPARLPSSPTEIVSIKVPTRLAAPRSRWGGGSPAGRPSPTGGRARPRPHLSRSLFRAAQPMAIAKPRATASAGGGGVAQTPAPDAAPLPRRLRGRGARPPAPRRVRSPPPGGGAGWGQAPARTSGVFQAARRVGDGDSRPWSFITLIEAPGFLT